MLMNWKCEYIKGMGMYSLTWGGNFLTLFVLFFFSCFLGDSRIKRDGMRNVFQVISDRNEVKTA